MAVHSENSPIENELATREAVFLEYCGASLRMGQVVVHAEKERRKIPPIKRTRPMSYREAARHMGKGDSRDAAEWLSAAVEEGAFACEHVSRQTHIFSVDDFPKGVRTSILPR
jgi:hypothetical protein